MKSIGRRSKSSPRETTFTSSTFGGDVQSPEGKQSKSILVAQCEKDLGTNTASRLILPPGRRSKLESMKSPRSERKLEPVVVSVQ
jgi:hypothetical protein